MPPRLDIIGTMLMLVFFTLIHLLGVSGELSPSDSLMGPGLEIGSSTYNLHDPRDISDLSSTLDPSSPTPTGHRHHKCDWFPLPIGAGIVPVLPEMYSKGDGEKHDENKDQKRDDEFGKTGSLCLPDEYFVEEISFGSVSTDLTYGKKSVSDMGPVAFGYPTPWGVSRCNFFDLPTGSTAADVLPTKARRSGGDGDEPMMYDNVGAICLPEGYYAQDIAIRVFPSGLLGKREAAGEETESIVSNHIEDRGGNPKGTGTTVTLGPPFTHGKEARSESSSSSPTSSALRMTGIPLESDLDSQPAIDIPDDQVYKPRWFRRAINVAAGAAAGAQGAAGAIINAQDAAANAQQRDDPAHGINPPHPHNRNPQSTPGSSNTASAPAPNNPRGILPSEIDQLFQSILERHVDDEREYHTDPNEPGIYTSNGLIWGTDDIGLPGGIHDRNQPSNGLSPTNVIEPRVITEPNFWLPGEPFDTTTSSVDSIISSGPGLVSRVNNRCVHSKRGIHTDPNEPGIYTSNGLIWGTDDIELPGGIHDRAVTEKEYHTDPNEPEIYTSNGLIWGTDDIEFPGGIHDRSWAQARKTKVARAEDVPSPDETSASESSMLPIPPEWTAGPYMRPRDTDEANEVNTEEDRSQKCRCSSSQLGLLTDIRDSTDPDAADVNSAAARDRRRMFRQVLEESNLWDASVKRRAIRARKLDHDDPTQLVKKCDCTAQLTDGNKERMHDIEHCFDPAHHEEHVLECAQGGNCDKRKRLHDLEHCSDPAHHEEHILECAQGGNCDRAAHIKRASTYTCDKQCLINWDICDKDRRWCCKLDDFKEMNCRDTRCWSDGWEMMFKVLTKMPQKCHLKPSGPEECAEDEAIACYWKDEDGPITGCLTWHPTGGETTNFYVGLRPDSTGWEKAWADRWFKELDWQWEKEGANYNDLRERGD